MRPIVLTTVGGSLLVLLSACAAEFESNPTQYVGKYELSAVDGLYHYVLELKPNGEFYVFDMGERIRRRRNDADRWSGRWRLVGHQEMDLRVLESYFDSAGVWAHPDAGFTARIEGESLRVVRVLPPVKASGSDSLFAFIDQEVFVPKGEK